MLYRSKPQEVEAVQWLGDEYEIEAIAPGKFVTKGWGDQVRGMLKAGAGGAQGWVDVPFGHWIVRQPGDVSDVWPVDPDYFADKYEPVG